MVGKTLSAVYYASIVVFFSVTFGTANGSFKITYLKDTMAT